MDVQVKTLTGQTTNIRVARDDTVKEFKTRIQLTSISYPSHLQELYYNGEVLDNEAMLKEYDVTDGAQVDVRMKVELGTDLSGPHSKPQSASSQKGSSCCAFC